MGVSIALNLAYLNIPAFGYVTRVKSALKERLDKIDQNVKDSLCDTTWFKQIDGLANVESIDIEFPSKNRPWISAPGLWGFLYNILFYWRIGRGLSILGTAYALSLLVLGVGHTTQAIPLWECKFNASSIGYALFWTACTLFWPITVVMAGSHVCASAGRFVKYQTASLKETAVSEATEALAEAVDRVAEEARPQVTPRRIVVRPFPGSPQVPKARD